MNPRASAPSTAALDDSLRKLVETVLSRDPSLSPDNRLALILPLLLPPALRSCCRFRQLRRDCLELAVASSAAAQELRFAESFLLARLGDVRERCGLPQIRSLRASCEPQRFERLKAMPAPSPPPQTLSPELDQQLAAIGDEALRRNLTRLLHAAPPASDEG